jgi:hypothetical protein
MAKAGQVGQLEAVILAGQGRLLASLGKAWNEEVRTLIKKIPAIQVLTLFISHQKLFQFSTKACTVFAVNLLKCFLL